MVIKKESKRGLYMTSKEIKIPLEKQFSEISKLIRESKEKALLSVNTELINLYWNIGKYVCKKLETAEWGSGIVKELAEYIEKANPGIKGFSVKNIWRMKSFYEIYVNEDNLLEEIKRITWTNNLMIISKCKLPKERDFYIRLAIKEKYSSRELERQIDSGLFERTVLSDEKVSALLRQIHPAAVDTFKDSYMLDFLSLPIPFSEKELRKGIVENLKKFILEFGKDFTFVGEEYRLQVGNKDFYIDLLFYHRDLQCLVAIDLKIDDFKPEYLGKMEFYLEALDRDVKKEHEKPSVGIILCKSKDSKVVEYALSRSASLALIAEYETKLIDKKLLEKKLDEFFMLSENID